MAALRTWTDAELHKAHAGARSMRALMCSLDLVVNGSNNRSLKKHLARLALPVPRVVPLTNAEKQARYRSCHPGYSSASTKEHQKQNPETWAMYARNRRAKKAGAEGTFTAEEFRHLCEFYSHQCLCCGKIAVKLTVDHVRPPSKGGSNNIDNIQPLCGPCNSRKHTKTVDYRTGV